ncbi:MAG TPA: thioesterase family protein [Haliangiales bacterium]|nr:thioesterase family protein [Haliangiales bacterium]
MVFPREELRASRGGFVTTRAIRFQDIDAAGIVFFGRLFDYFHDTCVAWMDAHGLRLHEAIKTGAWGAPLKHAEADFLRPMRFGDEIQVAVAAARLDGSELSVGYRISRGDEVCAVGTLVHVFLDLATFRRVPPPPEMTAAVSAL